MVDLHRILLVGVLFKKFTKYRFLIILHGPILTETDPSPHKAVQKNPNPLPPIKLYKGSAGFFQWGAVIEVFLGLASAFTIGLLGPL